MTKKAVWISLTAAGIVLGWQQSDVIIKLTQGERPAIAIPDFRGSGEAQQFMDTFNSTLFDELSSSGLFRMVAKSMYPLNNPQRPEDIRAAPSEPRTPTHGLALGDWTAPPASANYLAFGYTAIQNNQLVLYGWLYNAAQTTLSGAQVLGKIYLGGMDDAGARKVAREFAADIIAQFGGQSLLGSRIYFVSDRTGSQEIWSMDPDGSNQQQVTRYGAISIMPSVSPDGTKIAFTSYAKGNPAIFIHSVETGRRLPFYNQVASMNATPDFTPDGQHLVYSSTASGWAQIYIANMDGSGLRRISSTRAIEVEPKVNPKNGSEMVFVSGRTGPQQIFRMNLDGTDIQRLTPGEGEASNPSWHPNGQLVAYAWTRGFATGNFNVFIMDVATRQYNQLTHSAGRNENPSWAPDGRHIVFGSTRSGNSQIWSMLADGTQLKRLTTQGRNKTPVWGR
jgi:TolB protein